MTRLGGLIRAFVPRAIEVDEDGDSVFLRGTFGSASDQGAWLAAVRELDGIRLHDKGMDTPVEPREAFDPDRVVDINIRKPRILGVSTHYLMLGATKEWVVKDPPNRRVLCAELGTVGAFRSEGVSVERWDLSVPGPCEPAGEPLDPRGHLHDYTGCEVTADLRPWLLTAAPAEASPVFLAWRAGAARRLLGALMSAAHSEGDAVMLVVRSPGLRIRADSPEVVTAFESVTEAARWVFRGGSDGDARHILFTGELARLGSDERGLPYTVAVALEAAKAAYEAYVHASSRETLEALTELRKAVHEESQSVILRAHEMAAGIWAAVTLAAAPFVVSAISAQATPWITTGFSAAVAVLLIVSFLIQAWIGFRALSVQVAARQRWLLPLRRFLTAADGTEVADTPIREAIVTFKVTVAVVGAVNALLVCLLVWYGVETYPASPAVSTPAITAPPAPSALPAGGDSDP